MLDKKFVNFESQDDLERKSIDYRDEHNNIVYK